MAVTRQKKEAIVDELIKAWQESKSVVFTQYQGTNVKDMRNLRKSLTEKKVKFKVARKTLMTLAAKKAGLDEIPADFMHGPIGLAFGMEDEIAPAKLIHEFGKTHESIKIVGALFEGKLIPAADAKVIASLPGREVLLTRLVISMKAPISGFHSVLHGLVRNFVYVLSEVQKKKASVT